MALSYTVATLEGLEESIAALYVKDGEIFKLGVEGLDTGEELKEALRKEREERKNAKLENEALRRANEDAERKRNEENGNFEKLWQESQERETQASAKLTELMEANKNKDISAKAKELAFLSDNAAKVDMLANVAKQYISYSEEGVKLMIDGVEVQAEDVKNKLTKDYPFLVDGSKAAGGGATGQSNGVAVGDKQVTRAEFEAKGQGERASFVKEGGKVID